MNELKGSDRKQLISTTKQILGEKEILLKVLKGWMEARILRRRILYRN